jgi:hypothetical protein
MIRLHRNLTNTAIHAVGELINEEIEGEGLRWRTRDRERKPNNRKNREANEVYDLLLRLQVKSAFFCRTLLGNKNNGSHLNENFSTF